MSTLDPLDWLRDPSILIERASRYDSAEFDPATWGFIAGTFDSVSDYSPAKLEIAVRKTQGLHRQQGLQALFAQLTRNASTDRERVTAVASFVRKALRHNTEWQPMYRKDGVSLAVADPLVLLQLGEGRCGHANRLVADILEANGYRARIVQVSAHQSVEAYYDDSWHLAEANFFDIDVAPALDGATPSIARLCSMPQLLDQLPTSPYLGLHTRRLLDEIRPLSSYSVPYPSSVFCNYSSLPGTAAQYYRKISNGQPDDLAFGWHGYTAEVANDLPHRPDLTNHLPSHAPILEVSPTAHGVHLRWREAQDADGDLAGYEVRVDYASRGWNYAGPLVNPDIEPWMSTHVHLREHAPTGSLPAGKVARIFTTGTSAQLPLPPFREYYISVMAVDRYGLLVGRQHFQLSEEIRVFVSES